MTWGAMPICCNNTHKSNLLNSASMVESNGRSLRLRSFRGMCIGLRPTFRLYFISMTGAPRCDEPATAVRGTSRPMANKPYAARRELQPPGKPARWHAPAAKRRMQAHRTQRRRRNRHRMRRGRRACFTLAGIRYARIGGARHSAVRQPSACRRMQAPLLPHKIPQPVAARAVSWRRLAERMPHASAVPGERGGIQYSAPSPGSDRSSKERTSAPGGGGKCPCRAVGGGMACSGNQAGSRATASSRGRRH